MAKSYPSFFTPFTWVSALIGWNGLILQFYLSINSALGNNQGFGWGLFIYFGYFTILTNIFAASTLSARVAFPRSAPGRFFLQPSVITAMTAAMIAVGIVYSLLLRHIWDPQGLQLLADRLLHDIMPILVLVYWWFTVPKGSIHWSHIPRWSIYPVIYAIYVLLRGAISGVYPYPFIEVNELGYWQVGINIMLILIGFWVISALLVGISQLKKPGLPSDHMV
ncbi:Pr6Pr family membrane protein [Leptolyngbya sp. AN02str]|uniref:Pr6Pr family membrane protein n=1 Tax=Leptolyngbya sp. AN02str TaxID=3423363 RepID=UPI003D31412E